MTDVAQGITDAAIADFERDGAAVLRGVIEPHWVEKMRAAIDDAMADTSAAYSVARGFYNGFFHWQRNSVFRDFILTSQLGALAAKFLRAHEVNFFYDQLMVKEAGLGDVTPWHIDSTYFPTRDGKVLSIWVPFDRATPASGAVTYFKGSHDWLRSRGRAETEAFIKELPVPGSTIADHDFLAWSRAPGDVLVHHVDTLHGAPANRTTGRRRALATRWTDQDVRYDPRPDDFIAMGRNAGLPMPIITLTAGDRLTSPQFPRAWPRQT